MTGILPPDGIARRVESEPLLLLGGGRALLMQLAHPSVAAGVADHSDFRSDSLARLRQTVTAVSTIEFGTEDQAREVADGLRAVHERVVGPGYRANDPALQLWVHAALVDTNLRTYSRFFRPLTPDEAERYYQEMTLVAEVVGIPREIQPTELTAFRRYVRAMVGSLEVTDTARELAHHVLNPPWGVAVEPALALHRSVTAGLLPARLRRQYGLRWDWPGHFALQTATAVSRLVLPRLPRPVRRAPGFLL
jgi:uncharacterized protein (DUF2236 family)